MTKPVLLMPVWECADWSAAAIFCQNVLTCLSAVPEEDRPAVFLMASDKASKAVVAELARLSIVWGVLDQAGRPRQLRPAAKAEIMPDGLIDESRLQAVMNRTVATFPVHHVDPKIPRPVYWLSDFRHLRLPDMFSDHQRMERDLRFKQISMQSGTLLLSSRACLKDFHEFFPAARIEPKVWSFVSCIDPTADPFDDPRPALGLPDTFFYIPDPCWKHKDFETAIRAMGILKDRGIEVTIAAAGPTADFRHPVHVEATMALAEELGVRDRFHNLGILDRATQIQVFRAATAVLQPFWFEGWSTSIEDARSIGRPVIAADTAIHREQAPPGSRFFAMGSPQALADVLEAALPDLAPGPDPAAEAKAAAALWRGLSGKGLALLDLLGFPLTRNGRPSKGDHNLRTPEWDASPPAPDGLHCFRVPNGRVQWYGPTLLNAETVGVRHWAGDYTGLAERFLGKIEADDYIAFLRGYIAEGRKRFGADWRYADIVSVLLCLADMLQPANYLEIGVRRGRSACAVGWRSPRTDMLLCDMWVGDYAGIENPGPDFVAQQLKAVGHQGEVAFLNGNSHDVLPAWFKDNPDRFFDLITVDGDHSAEGAAEDLATVMPRLRCGGALVFDDIAHPLHPELKDVWQDVVLADPHFSSWSYRELGYGVGFAIRQT